MHILYLNDSNDTHNNLGVIFTFQMEHVEIKGHRAMFKKWWPFVDGLTIPHKSVSHDFLGHTFACIDNFGQLCVHFVYVYTLLCVHFVMCTLCYVYTLLCVHFVMCTLCYVYTLLCAHFVMCTLCYVYTLLCVHFVMCTLCCVYTL